MKIVEISFLQSKLYSKILPNGLTVSVLPRPEFHQTYGIFATDFGSIDCEFIPNGQKEWIRIPNGTAHFLEHKMFEKKTGDVFQQFAKQGASANAYTSFTRTAYLFSCTDAVWKNTETLIDFVQEPYFTSETVQKEQGIIGEEIQMYRDDINWQLYFGTIGSMYPTHPVQIDIAGTKDSIAEITTDILYACHQTFYHPSNMVLFLVGNVYPEEIIDRIENNQSKKLFHPTMPIVRKIYYEDGKVTSNKLEMAVQMPKMNIGLRADIAYEKNGGQRIKDEWIKSLLLYYLFGPQSQNYLELMEQELFTNQFSFDYTEERSFGFGIIGGQTKHPEALKNKIFQILQESQKGNFDVEDFERLMKKQHGQFLMSFRNLDWIANQSIRYMLQGTSLFEIPEMIQTICIEDFVTAAQNWFCPENLSSFTIFPRK